MLTPTIIGALYEQHWPEIYRFLRSRMSRGSNQDGASDQDVEDVAAMVFEKVVRYSGQYEERGNSRAWLYRIAQNTLTDLGRVRANRPPPVDIDDLVSDDPAVYDAGADAQIEALDMDRLLRKLTKLQRFAIIDQYWAGAEVAETAKALGKTEDAVKKLRYHAKKRIQEEVAREILRRPIGGVSARSGYRDGGIGTGVPVRVGRAVR